MAPNNPCLLVFTTCVVTFHTASELVSVAKRIQKGWHVMSFPTLDFKKMASDLGVPPLPSLSLTGYIAGSLLPYTEQSYGRGPCVKELNPPSISLESVLKADSPTLQETAALANNLDCSLMRGPESE